NGSVTLHWHATPETDVREFQLYRGSTPDVPADAAHFVATVRDTQHVDGGSPGSYYALRAVDVHGNVGALVVTSLLGRTFGIEAVTPNPSVAGQGMVELALPDGSPARLALVDVAGRTVASLALRQAGRQTVALPGANRLRPGLYWLRLTQGANTRTRRLAV